MSSNQQQGRGGGRGRGGDRGSSRGGDRGGSRGGRGDSSGRGRGDSQAGRGSREYQGDRGRGRGGGGPPGRGQSQQMAYRGGPTGGGQQGSRDPEPGVFLDGQQPPPPKTTVTNTENSMIANIKGKVIDGFPTRPGYGEQGERITLRVNCFELIANMDLNKADVPLYSYALSTPNQLSGSQKNLLMRTIVARAPFTDNDMYWATDYANIVVTTKQLANAGQKLQVEVRNPLEDYPSDGGAPQAVQRRRRQYKFDYQDTFNLRHLVTYLRNPSAGAHYAGRVDLIQLLNIIINKYAADETAINRVGQNKFYPAPGHHRVVARDLGEGLKALRGYFSSVRTSVNRILINVNVAHAAFYNDCALRQLVSDFCQGYNPPATDTASLALLEPFLYLVRVSTKYIRARDENGNVIPGSEPLRKVKTIAGLVKETNKGAVRYLDATQATFQYSRTPGGALQETTVASYFQMHHGITLQFPEEPVLNVGRRDDPAYLPMELCQVLSGQPVRRLLQGNQTSTMIRFAARPPNANAHSIQGLARNGPGLDMFKMREEDKQQWQQPFGFEVDPNMITVPARILPSPQVGYKQSNTTPRFGTWNLVGKDGDHVKFYKTGRFAKWGAIVINQQLPPALFNGFDQELRSYGIDMGKKMDAIPIQLPNWKQHNQRGSVNRVLDKTFQRAKGANINILLIVLKDKDQWLYSRIKFYGDIKYGIHTINAVGDNLMKTKNQGMLFGNLALKFNIKAGGTNHRITLDKLKPFDERTILFGIDVTHPSPGSTDNAPSIAGVVANRDQDLCQWPASIRTQTGRVEMVEELADMIEERFKTWNKHNKQLPNKVIVYRDGVSEGQYSQVLEREKPAFDKVFEKLYGSKDKWPKLGIIIVGKRHHMRFYPTQVKDADRTFNCKPGTVVDRGVTHHTRHDFYLQAHAVLQGTGRAAHYEVIKDDIGFGADELQSFTHRLCYLFSRATKAVSVCPPAYYADLLCERGRAYLYSTLNENKSSNSARYNANQSEWTSGVHGDLADSTFYI